MIKIVKIRNASDDYRKDNQHHIAKKLLAMQKVVNKTIKNNVIIVSVCVCYWPPVCRVCLNYKVVEFQPRKPISPKHRFCSLLLHSYSWIDLPYPTAAQCPPGGGNPLLPRRSLHIRPSCIRTGSYSHPGVTCIRTSITILLIPVSQVSPVRRQQE